MRAIARERHVTAHRQAFTVLELLVVLAILAVILGLLFPALHKARVAADRSTCANNLRQIGLAALQHRDAQGVWPHYRLCPAPWRNGQDLFCETVPALNFFTGANEIWWAPYDNRVAPTDLPLPDFTPQRSILWGHLRDRRIFHCPAGLDMQEGSPTKGKTFQISYAMDIRLGGARLANMSTSGTPSVADHMDLPGCAGVQGHWMPAGSESLTPSARHAPDRHGGVYNSLYMDGHVVSAIRVP